MHVRDRFDLEQSQAQDEVQRERIQREKLGRERDMLTGEVFTVRQQLQVSCGFQGTKEPSYVGEHYL